MYTVDVLIGFDDHMSLYTINQDVVEEVLRTERPARAIDLVVESGVRQEDATLDEGDIFLSYLDEDFGVFHNALMDLVCDLEAEA